MQFIDNKQNFDNLCQNLINQKYIAIDTEFLREKTYYPILCLLQIATKENIYLIDTIAIEDIDSLKPILQSQNITKIFHSARQDLEIFYQYFFSMPNNIFDTQIAAAFCGLEQEISYENLVKHIFNITIDKTYRISDWKKRPLSTKQMAYATEDVVHLIKLYPILNKNLIEEDKFSYFIQEIENLYNKDIFTNYVDQAWKKFKTVTKNNNFLLKEIAKWRELKAIYYNIPRNHFLSEQNINKIIENIPLSKQEFYKLKIETFLDEDDIIELLDIIKNSLKNNQEFDHQIKTIPIHDNHFNSKITLLKKLLLEISKKYNISEELIIRSSDLKKLIHHKLEPDNKILSGWRYQIFTKQALDELNNFTQ